MQIFNISVVQETLLHTRALPLPLIHSISIGKGYLHVGHTYIYRYFLHKNIQNHFKSRLSLSLSLPPPLSCYILVQMLALTRVFIRVCVYVCVRVPFMWVIECVCACMVSLLWVLLVYVRPSIHLSCTFVWVMICCVCSPDVGFVVVVV